MNSSIQGDAEWLRSLPEWVDTGGKLHGPVGERLEAIAARLSTSPIAEPTLLAAIADAKECLRLREHGSPHIKYSTVEALLAATTTPQEGPREAYWERPFGDAGDAIDFACDHCGPDEALAFLEDWRSAPHSNLAAAWPGYMRWLQVQHDGAKEASMRSAASQALPSSEEPSDPYLGRIKADGFIGMHSDKCDYFTSCGQKPCNMDCCE